MKKNLFWLFLFCACLNFSCTSLLFVETTLPAKVKIARDQWKVVAINRYNPALVQAEDAEIVQVYADGAREAFYGAVDAILDDSTYLLVHTDTTSFRMQSPGDSLRPAQVREIFQQHPHHLLLSLDHFDIELDQQMVDVENTDGSVSTIAEYYLITRASWTLFDSAGTVLDRTSLMREDLYKSRPALLGILAIGPSLSNAGPAINHLAWNTGYDYWTRLSPQPITYARPYYSGKPFKAAAAAMVAEEWETAISLLMPMTEGTNKKEAARAAYNLAVIYEALGNIEEAKYWASEAASKGNPFARQLLVALENYGQ